MHLESLPETCIPSLESFEPMMTKLRSGQEMLYKINQRWIIRKRKNVELWLLCTALQFIARKMHTKFKVIWTYDDNVTLRTRNAHKINQRGINKNRNKVELRFLCTALRVIARKNAYQVWSHLDLWWQSYAPDMESGTTRTRTTRTPPTKVIPICRLFMGCYDFFCNCGRTKCG